MPSSRRRFLGSLGAVALGGLAGCSALRGGGSDAAPVTVEVGGSLEDERFVELEVVADDATAGLSEHVVFRQPLTVGPDGPVDSDGVYADAFDAQRALVRVGVGGVGVVGEYTFVPDCRASDEVGDRLSVSLQSALAVTFRQNRCR